MGVAFFIFYYLMFRFVIVHWNMRTPGREPDDEFEAEQAAKLTDGSSGADASGSTGAERTEQLIAAFGGRDNLINVDACIARLRIELADKNEVNKPRLKALGLDTVQLDGEGFTILVEEGAHVDTGTPGHRSSPWTCRPSLPPAATRSCQSS